MHLCTLLGLLAATSTALSALTAPIEGYGVVDLVWEVQAFVDGPKMNLTGTVESVVAQLQAINPNVMDDFGLNKNNTTEEPAALQKRFGPVCGGGTYKWSDANGIDIKYGIQYLRGVAGKPANGPGPGNCGRVSCSYKSAIWWCNDNTYTFQLPGFNTIADCATVLYNQCVVEHFNGYDVYYSVVGQNFNGNNWNCIIRGDYDNC